MVYGIDDVFPVQLVTPVIKFMQEIKEELDDIKRRMFQIVQLQQERKALKDTAERQQRRMKEIFDKKV